MGECGASRQRVERHHLWRGRGRRALRGRSHGGRAVPNRRPDTDANANPDSDSNSHADGDTNGDSNGYANSYSNANASASYADTHPDPGSKRAASADSRAERDASWHAAASTVEGAPYSLFAGTGRRRKLC